MSKINAEVISVKPDKVKISVEDLNDFKLAEENLKVGSYLQISDDNDVILFAIIESFSIDLVNTKDENGEAKLDRRYIIEASPIGTLIDSKFERGGDTLSIPPKSVKPAETEYIKEIFENSIDEKRKFTFSKLANKLDISVPVDGNKFFNKHLAIIGASGSGKSNTTAKIFQTVAELKNSNFSDLNNSHIIIFDIHSEYSSAFPKANKLSIENLVLPYWLLNGDELEEIFLDTGDKNNYNQTSLLRKIITANKKYHNELQDKIYFDSPIKFNIQEVLNCLKNLKNETKNYKSIDDRIMIVNEQYTLTDGKTDSASGIFFENEVIKIQEYFKKVYEFYPSKGQNIKNGDYNDGSIDKFISRFESKVMDSRLDFLFGETSSNISFEETLRNFMGYSSGSEANITVIDLSGIPFEILSITVSLVSRIMFEFAYYSKKVLGTNPTPLILVYEEAHKYAPKSNLAKFRSSQLAIERIAKEGRKYGVTLAIVSQRPSEISETIFSQCNNFITMRLTNPDDQNFVKRLLPDSLNGITDILPALKGGEALIIGDSIIMPSIVKIDECEFKPSSSDIDYIEMWKDPWKEINFLELIDKWEK